MEARALGLMAVVAAGACADVEAAPRKQVVTASLSACAVAFSDPASGKAGGGETGPMTLTCTVGNRGKTWDCVSAYPGEEEKSQHWLLKGPKACNVLADSMSLCTLKNDTGSMWVQLGAAKGIGIVTLRLDVDTSPVSAGAVGARVCSGTLTTGSL
jgi:hypothetical protein